MTHPDTLTLHRLAVGELDGDHRAGVDSHLAECAACREQLSRIRQELDAARAAIPARAPLAAYRRREALQRRRPIPWVAAAAGWAIAACLMLAWAPWNDAGDSSGGTQSVTRTRGTMAVSVQRARGPSVDRIGPVAVCRRGDRLQFGPDLPAHGYFQIINLQDDGRSQVYLPPTPAGRSEGPLDFSIELDDYPGTERVFFVWTAEPVDSNELESRAAGALQLRPIEELAEIPLPRGFEGEQQSLLIYKGGGP